MKLVHGKVSIDLNTKLASPNVGRAIVAKSRARLALLNRPGVPRLEGVWVFVTGPGSPHNTLVNDTSLVLRCTRSSR